MTSTAIKRQQQNPTSSVPHSSERGGQVDSSPHHAQLFSPIVEEDPHVSCPSSPIFAASSNRQSENDAVKKRVLIQIKNLVEKFLKDYSDELLKKDEIKLLTQIKTLNDLREMRGLIKRHLEGEEFVSRAFLSTKLLFEDLLRVIYSCLIQDDVQNINNSLKSKTSSKMSDILYGIQENYLAFSQLNNFKEEAIATLQKLCIDGLRNRKECQSFIDAIVYLEQHKASWFNFIVSPIFKKLNIEDILESIGYVYNKKISTPQRSLVYSGFIDKNNRPHGFGKGEWEKDGDRYQHQGGWEEEQRIGPGVLTFYTLTQNARQRVVSIGYWKNDELHGFAVSTADTGQYVGNYQAGRMHGFGAYFYKSGNLNIGFLSNNQASGFGAMFYAKGDQYLGAFENDIMDGYGRYTWVDGRQYEGEWKGGRQNGAGRQLYNGHIQEGIWKDGQLTTPRPIADRLAEKKRAFELDKQNYIEEKKRFEKQRKDFYSSLILEPTSLIPDLADIVTDYFLDQLKECV